MTGLTGIGVDGGTAVLAVLTFRVLTFWLPILPGALALRSVNRREFA